MSEGIECDICGEGSYEHRILDRYDASPLIGVDGVTLVGAPAWVCRSCNAVMLEGGALDEALEALTLVLIETDGPLRPKEIRRHALDGAVQAVPTNEGHGPQCAEYAGRASITSQVGSNRSRWCSSSRTGRWNVNPVARALRLPRSHLSSHRFASEPRGAAKLAQQDAPIANRIRDLVARRGSYAYRSVKDLLDGQNAAPRLNEKPIYRMMRDTAAYCSALPGSVSRAHDGKLPLNVTFHWVCRELASWARVTRGHLTNMGHEP
jgi:hypothetical protein